MSRQALVISLVLVIALSIIAIATLLSGGRGAAPAAKGAALLEIDPARVTAIAMDHEDGDRVEVVEREPEGGWRLRIARPGPEGLTWPVQPSRVRALLSVLNQMKAEAAPQEPAPTPMAGDTALTVRIAQEGGAETTLRFTGGAIGGVRLVTVGGERSGYVDDAIYRALTSPGPRGWRDTSAAPGFGADASRLVIVSGDRRVSLDRVGSRWVIREPAPARASEEAVRKAIGSIAEFTIRRFIDDPGGMREEDFGFDRALARIIAETDERRVDDDGNVVVETETRSLVIGGLADLEGEELFARPGSGDIVFVVGAGPLSTLPVDPARYLDATATDELPANVAALRIAGPGGAETYERTAGGWSSDASGTLDPERSEAIEETLGFLAAARAARVSYVEDPMEADVRATLLDFESNPIVQLDLAEIDGALAIERVDVIGAQQRVLRTYSGGEAPDLLRDAVGLSGDDSD